MKRLLAHLLRQPSQALPPSSDKTVEVSMLAGTTWGMGPEDVAFPERSLCPLGVPVGVLNEHYVEAHDAHTY